MKQVKYFLLAIFSFILFSTNVMAATNPYGKYQTLYGPKTVRCTWYAWQQAYDNAGVVLPGWGNAQTWYASARKAGYSVGLTPKANSIIVYSSYDNYGHVAYVTKVEGNNITINEGGAIESQPRECREGETEPCTRVVASNGNGIRNGEVINMDYYGNDNLGSLIGFIYLDNAPKKTNNSSSSNSSSSSSAKPKSKSKNNKLKSLTLDVKEINFVNDIHEYYVEVDYNVKIATIKAETEDAKARALGAGAKALNVGDNIYKIQSIAENGDTLEYTINITRNEKIEEVENVEEKKEVEIVQKKNDKILIYAIVVIIVIIVMVLVCLFVKKKKKNRKKKK